MADTEQIRQQVQSPAPFSTWLGVLLLMVLFWVIAVAIIGPAPRGDTYEQQRAQNREKKLKDLREEDAKALTGYAWIDKNKGTVRIPIERAMQLTVTELAAKRPMLAGPIAAAAAEASVAPSAAPSASSAPSASPHATGTPKPTTVEGPNSESRGQPAAATNPPPVKPGTQPGANSAATAAPKASAAAPATSPAQSATPAPSP
ncbi:MAG: hypothetical protein JO356_21885 [Acidobacteria bacterium]|nr:hypothetical protein [Acidobacteriota bacterium]